MSTIPGQGVNPDETILNPQLLFIGVLSMTVSFLVSIQWGGFVTSSVEAVQEATNHRIPVQGVNPDETILNPQLLFIGI